MAAEPTEVYYKLSDSLVWTPTSEETGFEASNLLDGLDVTWWLSTSGATQYLTYDSGVGNTIDFDYMALGADHNLNTVGATVTWQKADNALSWSDIVPGVTPSNNKSLVQRAGSTQTYRAVRAVITGASGPIAITLLYVGLKTVLDFADLYDPQRRKRNQVINITEGGRLAGGAIRYTQREIRLKFRLVADALYQEIDSLWEDQGIKIFFLAWEPGDNPDDIYPVYIDDSGRNAPFILNAGVLRRDGLKLKGFFE